MPVFWFLAVMADNHVGANSAPFTASLPSQGLYPVWDSIIHCNGKDDDALAWSMTSLYSSATGNKDTHFFFIIVLVIIDNWRKWMAENNYGQTRWSADQTGKCKGASLSFVPTTISEHYKDIIVLFSIHSWNHCCFYQQLHNSLLAAVTPPPQYVFDSVIW